MKTGLRSTCASLRGLIWILMGALSLSSGAILKAAEVSDLEPVVNFALLDQRGEMHELRRTGAKAVVLFFTANGCPIARQNASKIRSLRERYSQKGIDVMMVNSALADDRKSISKEASELGVWHVPVLKDDTQGVARHLKVNRTCEAIAISTKDWRIFYRGAVDDQLVEGAQKPSPSVSYLENAIEDFLNEKPIRESHTVARGCRIEFDGGEGADTTPVSYSATIAPLLQQKCVGCHSPGNIGSWPMSHYKKVKSMASMIEEVLLTRRMPPWDADPAIGKFSNDCSLSPDQAKLLIRWIHQGAPRGEGPDPLEGYAVAPAQDWPLGKPDLILRLPKPEKIPATGVVDYRHIEVSAGNTNALWVAGVFVKPGNRKVVHHLIARLKEGGHKDNLGQKEMFAGWAPGANLGYFPKGSGKLLPKDAKFDFEMHYTTNGTEQEDQTELGIYLMPEKPETRFETVPLVDTKFEIPPGDPDAHASAMFGLKKDAVLYSVTPHMHLRGKWMKFEALLPSGKREVICSVPRYDFNWQYTYLLEKPKKLPAGTWVMISGGYDNSSRNPANPDPTKTVHWGDQSFDEMFLGWYNVTWDPDAPKQASATPKETGASAAR